jgi:acetoin utilization deacetylase AcuC-like enzyme
LKVFYAATQLQPLPAGHRFPMGKYEKLKECLLKELPQIQLIQSKPASLGELALVHTPFYVEQVLNGQLPPEVQREIGFPWSEGMVERARASVGATIMAAKEALACGVSANMAGGTHHAYADRGGGFCVFNDVAVAARLIQSQTDRLLKKRSKVLLVDLDVHQGNGSAKIFANDPSVFTFSMHGAKNFPFRKEKSDMDIELPDGCEDGPYLEALDQALLCLAGQFQPDFIFYLAGADPHVGDRLGRLSISTEGLRARDERVFSWARQMRAPLAFVMAGGYGTQMEDTLKVQLNTFQAGEAAFQAWGQ